MHLQSGSSAQGLRVMKAIAFALALWLIPHAVGAADPFEINVVLPMTGPGAFAGKELQSAFTGLAAYVNRTGGIRGRPLKFTVQDDQTSTQMDVQMVTGLIAKGVPVILGPALAGGCDAVNPLEQKTGPVIYCFSPSVKPPAGSFMFSSNISTDDLLRAGMRYAHARGWDRIALISSTDASGQSGDISLDALLPLPENRSMSLVAREHFNPTDVSVAAQIARIKSSGAKILIVWTTGTPLATVLRAINDSGLDVPVLTSTANSIPAQLKQYDAFMPSQLIIASVASVAFDQVTDRGVHSAIELYSSEMGQLGEKPSPIKTVAWDPGLLLVNAYRALGTAANAEQIRAYLAKVQGFAGVTGRYNFRESPQRGLTVDDVYMVRWDKAKGDFVGISRAGGYLPR